MKEVDLDKRQWRTEAKDFGSITQLSMAIDGLIVLDNNNRPIIQSGFRSASIAYPILHIDTLSNALENASRSSDVDPVLYVPGISAEMGPSACCHISLNDLRLLACVSGDIDPLFAFAFLQTFSEILAEYFGVVSTAIVRENFDTIYQLLEETLDAGGHPLTTSPNALRDIVLPPSLLSKLLGSANLTSAININNTASGSAFGSPIPWRKLGLKYNNNEIFFDIIEDLRAVVNQNGTTLSSNVWGRIDSNSKLSGTPDCLLTFTKAHVLVDCAFHPCVRLQRFTKDRAFSFVPPDGKFTLADYRFSPTATSTIGVSATSTAPSSKDMIPVPFGIKSSIHPSSESTSFELILTPRSHPPTTLENVVVEWYLGNSPTNIKCTASRLSAGLSSKGGGFGNVPSTKSSGTGGGGQGCSWVWDGKRQVLKWEIPLLSPSSSYALRGSFTPSQKSRPSPSLQVTFLHAQSFNTYSNLKVDQLKITGENYKPYKGVRGRAGGNVEWRIGTGT